MLLRFSNEHQHQHLVSWIFESLIPSSNAGFVSLPDVSLSEDQLKSIAEAVELALKDYKPAFEEGINDSKSKKPGADVDAHLKNAKAFCEKKKQKLDEIKDKVNDGLGDTLKQPLMDQLNGNDETKQLPDKLKNKACDKAVSVAIGAAIDAALKKYAETLVNGATAAAGAVAGAASGAGEGAKKEEGGADA